ncbi:CYTH domain-containing protein [Curvibacter sp. CHRR-16]|uniref:CYTH domain-containing protein n=1 Tax=Curvibacter sp. CHRR-16 TaxID=2835872 RepID=UPI001BDA2335|nr:CYTH domain-containing protein [Curvibacter sp. CHRR-16]MBT0570510.1 CYTH domain-containing protein [Curvibacter sp. CHRR-16]
MALEIERKFLVNGQPWQGLIGQRLQQGYLNRDKARTMRVRIAGDTAWLTIKGASQGAVRNEFEYPIPVADAHTLLTLCDGPLIDKTRYRIPHANLVWEVDVFHGDNAGLVVAEVELADEHQAIALPDWVGAEVTHDVRYFNSALAQHAYKYW